MVYERLSAMDVVYPQFDFDENLREFPISQDDWNQFVINLKEKLKEATLLSDKLACFEHLGVANRILLNLDAAEYYLKQALNLTYKHPKQSKLVQNMIRLAHVYHWMKKFEKADLLFDQAWLLLCELPSGESLTASYHQHLGKFYFDQNLLLCAIVEFETAFSLRQKIGAPEDQIKSSELAINRVHFILNQPVSKITIRKAVLQDAEQIHLSHMKSIQEVCSKKHSQEEIAVWGHRPFNKEQRESAIKNDFVLVTEYLQKIEGYGHLRIFEKDSVKRAHIFGLYLTSTVSGQSIGKRMIDIMIEQCRYRNVKLITLESTLTANAFYKKNGFVEDGQEMMVHISGQPVRCYPMKIELM